MFYSHHASRSSPSPASNLTEDCELQMRLERSIRYLQEIVVALRSTGLQFRRSGLLLKFLKVLAHLFSLMHMYIDVVNSIQNLKIPTLDDVEEEVGRIVSIPFKLLENEIQDNE